MLSVLMHLCMELNWLIWLVRSIQELVRDLYKKVAGIASVANIPEIQAQSELINKILHTDYVDNAGINEFEDIRERSS